MATNIVTRITLDGAQEVVSQLKGIGTAASDAFSKLGDVNALNARFTALGSALQKFGQSAREFGIASRQAGQDLNAFGEAMGSTITRLTALAAAAGLAGGKLAETFKTLGADAEALQQNADAAGESTQQYEALRNALAQNGVGSDEAAKGLDKLAKFIVAASSQTDDYNKKLKKLREEYQKGGLSNKDYQEKLKDLQDGMGSAAQIADRYNLKLKNTDGSLKGVRDIALQLAGGLEKSDDATQKAADALELFGRNGRKIGQALGQGTQAIERLEITMQGLAPAAEKGLLEALTRMDDAFDNLSLSAASLKRAFLGTFANDVTHVVSAFTQFIVNNRDQIIGFAKVLRTELQPAITTFLNFVSGPDAKKNLSDLFVGALDGAKAFVGAITKIVIPAIKAVKIAADEVAAGINKVFGTELSGGVLLVALAIGQVTGALKLLGSALTLVISSAGLFIKAIPLLLNGLRVLAVVLLAPEAAIIALGIAIGVLVGLFIRSWPQIQAAVVGAWTAITAATSATWDAVTAIVGNAVTAVIAAFAAIPGAIVEQLRLTLVGMQAVWALIVASAQAAWAGVAAAFGGVLAFFTGLWAGIAAGWNALIAVLVSLPATVVQAFTDAFDGLKNYFTSWGTFVAEKFASLLKALQPLLDGVKSVASALGGTDGGSNTVQANAAGGFIRGPGTGTSDSILSRLSNGEYVVQARRVRQYGVGFMEALNRGRLSLKGMQLPQFNGGGLVHMAQSITPAIPRFAAGGLVSAPAAVVGGRPMVLQIGDTAFSGLTANESAVTALSRYSAGKSTRSAGRKPLWFKG